MSLIKVKSGQLSGLTDPEPEYYCDNPVREHLVLFIGSGASSTINCLIWFRLPNCQIQCLWIDKNCNVKYLMSMFTGTLVKIYWRIFVYKLNFNNWVEKKNWLALQMSNSLQFLKILFRLPGFITGLQPHGELSWVFSCLCFQLGLTLPGGAQHLVQLLVLMRELQRHTTTRKINALFIYLFIF